MNTPRNNSFIDPEDPKWTAYVLGELDEAERAEIERSGRNVGRSACTRGGTDGRDSDDEGRIVVVHAVDDVARTESRDS